jgi:hypothetical protein
VNKTVTKFHGFAGLKEPIATFTTAVEEERPQVLVDRSSFQLLP